MKKILWVCVVMLALLVGWIPVHYSIYGVSKGYLEFKSQEVLRSSLWWVFLYIHLIFGGIAIVIGWIQFSDRILKTKKAIHRTIGKIYTISALVCSISGLYIGFFATGGIIAQIGFILVSCIYFYTTLMGYIAIRKQKIMEHIHFMTYSYATCLAAVSLRVFVPLSFLFTDDYLFSYAIISWIAWIPNLIIAYFINKKRVKEIN